MVLFERKEVKKQKLTFKLYKSGKNFIKNNEK